MLHTDTLHVGMVLIMQLRYREVAGDNNLCAVALHEAGHLGSKERSAH